MVNFTNLYILSDNSVRNMVKDLLDKIEGGGDLIALEARRARMLLGLLHKKKGWGSTSICRAIDSHEHLVEEGNFLSFPKIVGKIL